MCDMRKLIVVVGPTGSGKSELAVALALRLGSGQARARFGINGAEIISADSRQVYRGLDIGSNKITKREMHGVPHHLLNIANPHSTFTAAQFQKLARKKTNEIWKRGKIPIICGGTGFYIQTLVDGIVMPAVKPNAALRRKLAGRSTSELFMLLKKRDPARAASIDRHNPRRLVRALEIAEALGIVPNLKINPLPAKTLFIGLAKETEELQKLTRTRIARWLRKGLLGEIKKLRKNGVSEKRIREFGLVYAWALKLFRKEITKEAFHTGLEKDMMHYIKRQMTWFRRDKRIHWISKPSKALFLTKNFLQNRVL
ncbi:tRNA (adenosine(37)-N6)-dimethylallyltransferase MiaA [Candidatus Jorgensenbacteria bacterium CG23_combo_of_CG06-09_8_20_14_all_54_14]|uniref:tRNA dimethylallyltransferase n=2 Tax=Candidatus Joergenseniibacteriota TaxID=1752739 RepID=A0A2G9ZBN8_9BACT|nr:MAG: tRNA (adenosine(37)-N6)-dimethylallyltransferase MiaA [Candidatus Jorgensenbacteria bacterium CG23_combo_of_CG06-09_8_20_14_all_54_14]